MRDYASAADAADACRTLGLDSHPVEGTYLYLLRMEGLSLVTEHRERHRRRANEMEGRLAALRETTVETLWRTELLELRATLLANDPRLADGRSGSP